MKKVFLKTFGCQMNSADSELMYRFFRKHNFTETKDLSLADAVLVNTCTVREHAKHRALSYIGRLEKWKNSKKNSLLIVSGCVAEELKEKLTARFPHIDLVTGAKAIESFPSALKSILRKKNFDGLSGKIYPEKTTVSSSVTIMRGCSHKCGYCIVPFVRGESVFYPPSKIMKDIELACSSGAKEIILLGQTVNAYRYKDIDFAALLKLISKVSEVKRIRYMSPHPIYINDEFIETIASEDKIAKHIHLPVQSGSDKILKLTKRGYARKKIVSIVGKLRDEIKDISISTDLIVGLPTETDKDFKETLSLVSECSFSNAYCFKYSPRENTELAKLKSSISEKTLENKLEKLLKKVKRQADINLKKQVGSEQEVLLETQNMGRTASNYRVWLNKNYRPASLLKVKIKSVFKHNLKGTVLK